MNRPSEIIHVYFMPGMAASPEIFEYIKLPKETFQMHFLKWKLPQKKESLESYALRMVQDIEHKNCVLIGVSLGGIVVQAMSEFLSLRRLIIISSVKTRFELPRRMRWARITGLYHLLPTFMVNYVEKLDFLPLGKFVKKRLKLYKRYMEVKNKHYLDWGFRKMIFWERKKPLEGIVHIHGEKDIVFPIKYIKNCIVVPSGTHIMIINKYRWFNRNLPRIICEGKL
ncbi:MAG TPA: alpha/beta hydrolase [Flavobacteriaceae bacterium]|nr:alpha/beta hydrolase [Flavobacteriaceae bacterium]